MRKVAGWICVVLSLLAFIGFLIEPDYVVLGPEVRVPVNEYTIRIEHPYKTTRMNTNSLFGSALFGVGAYWALLGRKRRELGNEI